MPRLSFRSGAALLALVGLNGGIAHGQIVLNTNLNAQTAVQNILLGPGITASNITFNGLPGTQFSSQLAGYNGVNCNIGSSGGIVLTTGACTNVFGPNNVGGSTQACVGPPCGGGDADLLQAAQLTNPGTNSINDGAVLEFDFIPTGDSLKFEFIFASEEYLEFVGSGFNDVFGFFLSGPGINGPYSNSAENIALVPGTATPVTINSVNDVSNSAYYIVNGTGADAPYNSSPTYIQYDGFTVKMMALAGVTCGLTYHIKIAIGDAGDTALDSAVFLEAGSFASNAVTLSSQIDFGGQDSTIYEGCGQATIMLARANGFLGTEIVELITQGVATEVLDYSELPDQVILSAGVDTVYLTIASVLDNLIEGPELVELIAVTNGPCGSDSTFLRFYIDDAPPIDFLMGPGASLPCPGDSAFVGATVGGGYGDLVLDWNAGVPDGTTAGWVTPGQTTTYTLTVTDDCGVFTQSGSATVIVPQPQPVVAIALPDTLSHCPEPSVTLQAGVLGGIPPYSYQWSDGMGITPQAQVAPPVTRTWSITVTDACGAFSSDEVTVTIAYDSVDIVASLDTTICFNDTARLSAVTFFGHGDHDVLWVDGATGLLHEVSPPWSMDHLVTVTDGCGISASDVVHVEVHRPSADFTHHTDQYTVAFPIQFVDQSQGGTNWLWEFDFEGETSEELYPVFTYPEPGIYTVILTITDDLGCIDSTYQVLFIDPAAHFYLPTSFTPNGDGINETYGASGAGVLDFEMRIFNRWGELIFNSDRMEDQWDGTLNGGAVPDGMYVVRVRVRDVLNVKREHFGQVTLMR